MRTIVALILGVLLLSAVGGWWLWDQMNTPFLGSQPDESFVELPSGADSRRIANILAEHGILRSAIPFGLYLRWTGQERRLKAGEYRFTKPATPAHIADRILRGDVFYHTVTIPEGLTAREVVELVARTGLSSVSELEAAVSRAEWIQDLDPEASNLEGYLFPDTYRVSRRSPGEAIVRGMVDRFRTEYFRLREETGNPDARDVRSIVTLASMVEKEAGHESERGLVASVLKNRLQLEIPLACDPTVIYALKLEGRYHGNIRKQDLQIRSPYNTYLHRGLPPGPIANPGAAALRAALSSPRTDFLYFVARNDGTHQFSKDLQSHIRAVSRYQKSAIR